MDKGSPVYYNSPVIQRNTPIKRLGLSRKRKSSGSDNSLIKKIAICADTVCSPVRTQNEVSSTQKSEDAKEICEEEIDFEKEIEVLEKRCQEKELELEALKLKGTHIEHLENLTEVWRVGCKSAYLHLIQLVKEREMDSVDYKTILNNLGVFKIMKETFENDSEVSLSDSSQ